MPLKSNRTCFVRPSVVQSEKFRKTALSVLINLCYNNVASLTFLTQAINLVDFQKKVSIEEYGILVRRELAAG